MASFDTDDIIAQLVPMFLDDTRSKVDTLHELVVELPRLDRKSDDFLEFARIVHSIKGSAGSFGFPSLGVICHKLEDYVGKTAHFSPKAVGDITAHLDAIESIISRGIDPSDAKSRLLFKQLPVPTEFGPEVAAPVFHLHALFIGPRDVQFRIVDAELRACGIQSTISPNSFHGVELAVRTHPDFIMVAYVVDLLDGIEIVRVIRAIKRLATTPVVFLKSEQPDERSRRAIRQALPEDVQIVRKGRHFSDDFANAMAALKIL